MSDSGFFLPRIAIASEPPPLHSKKSSVDDGEVGDVEVVAPTARRSHRSSRAPDAALNLVAASAALCVPGSGQTS